MSRTASRLAGAAPLILAPARPPAVFGPMTARILALVLLIALASWFAPAWAVEGAPKTVAGMNPGPFPKAPPKPATVKPGDGAKSEAAAEPVKSAETVRPAEVVHVAEAPQPPAPPAPKPPAYCAGIADAAADARFAWQKEQLAALEKQVEERIARLEAKRAEYESWLARRNAFLSKADEGVVAIYTKMRPDAAALQLANMPDESAAAILTKLNARTASAILSEMEAARAAQLARMMTDAGKKARESEKS